MRVKDQYQNIIFQVLSGISEGVHIINPTQYVIRVKFISWFSNEFL